MPIFIKNRIYNGIYFSFLKNIYLTPNFDLIENIGKEIRNKANLIFFLKRKLHDFRLKYWLNGHGVTKFFKEIKFGVFYDKSKARI